MVFYTMSTILITVQEPYASHIINGTKTVEGRLNKGKFAEAQVGDRVLLNDAVEFVIVEKNQYKTFREMLEQEGVENVIPNVETVDEAVEVYYQFYTSDQEKEFGVISLKIEKV